MSTANTISATVEFSFRGEHNTLTASLDVAHLTDLLMNNDERAVHRVIAGKNGLDTYSYAYEVMEMQPVVYTGASGLIAQFITDGELDVAGYIEVWQAKSACALQDTAGNTDSDMDKVLSEIAAEHLRIEVLAEFPEVQAALRAAYQAGRDSHAR